MSNISSMIFQFNFDSIVVFMTKKTKTWLISPRNYDCSTWKTQNQLIRKTITVCLILLNCVAYIPLAMTKMNLDKMVKNEKCLKNISLIQLDHLNYKLKYIFGCTLKNNWQKSIWNGKVNLSCVCFWLGFLNVEFQMF